MEVRRKQQQVEVEEGVVVMSLLGLAYTLDRLPVAWLCGRRNRTVRRSSSTTTAAGSHLTSSPSPKTATISSAKMPRINGLPILKTPFLGRISGGSRSTVEIGSGKGI